MKKRMMKILCGVCLATMMLGTLVGCGSSEKAKAENEATVQDVQTGTEADAANEAEGVEEAETEEASAGDGTLETLLASVEEEDSYMVLSGIGQGWAPTVMVLLNDGSFYCLVDYAGQAVVNFAMGEYVTNEDGSITATGALYTDGSELVYEIANTDGTYTVSVEIPDAGCSADLTGTLAE